MGEREFEPPSADCPARPPLISLLDETWRSMRNPHVGKKIIRNVKKEKKTKQLETKKGIKIGKWVRVN